MGTVQMFPLQPHYTRRGDHKSESSLRGPPFRIEERGGILSRSHLNHRRDTYIAKQFPPMVRPCSPTQVRSFYETGSAGPPNAVRASRGSFPPLTGEPSVMASCATRLVGSPPSCARAALSETTGWC